MGFEISRRRLDGRSGNETHRYYSDGRRGARSMTEERIIYQFPFVHKRTGERRVIAVALTRRECAEVMSMLEGWPGGPGGPNGPVAKRYALNHAAAAVARDFIAVVEGMKRVERLKP